MTWISPLTLRGNHCSLHPLSYQHHDALYDAVQDGDLAKLWYTLIPEPAKMHAEIARRLQLQADQAMLPFTIFDNQTNTPVGMTTYLNIDAETKRLEIGGTWLRRSVQGTPLNTEAKLLLLTHAFETLNCVAVEFRTHFLNTKSRRAIERLGAKLDGVLRNHMIMPNGTLRDTCVYSILAHEWASVKVLLAHRLEAK